MVPCASIIFIIILITLQCSVLTLLHSRSNIRSRKAIVILFEGILKMKLELTEIETEILNYLWDNGEWTSAAEFWIYFNENGRPSKRQTVNTFLTRMTDKGLLVKHDKKYMYALSRKEYEQELAKEVLSEMFDGSLKKFLSSLTGNQKITECEAEDLKKYIDDLA